jgi:hypothetical protein
MYRLSLKKMQNTPNLADPRIHGKRVRFDDERDGETSTRKLTRAGRRAEECYESPRSTTLHPTKGFRSRNLDRIARHGEVIRRLDEMRQRRG